MTGSLILFYIAATLVILGGIGVVITKNIVYAAFSLLVSMIGIAGVFLLAFAEFLALVQILIYGGAVVIVILFALMLTRIEDFRDLSDSRNRPLALLVSLILFAVLVASLIQTPTSTGERSHVSMVELGESLFTDWAIPFEVASLVLLVALIGAIVIVRRDTTDEEQGDSS
ncbi:MAG: NADH-quinone oxidoreductase subunit J [SAR202 cluster bacterium]|nr:NADH-quinone oxidoreductase subunit J [SAR202 cluster bacterium]